jgi:hypothetical protein
MPDTRQTRNPPWSRDELVLALNLYVASKGNPPGKSSQGVVELSNLLNQMDTQITNHASNFRKKPCLSRNPVPSENRAIRHM